MSGGDQNWQVGDLALCKYSGCWFDQYHRPRVGPLAGSVHTVTRVWQPGEKLLISLQDWPIEMGFWASAFTKIAPHALDEEDAETIRLLTGQPVTPAAPKTPELV
ncbi:MAG: hypothetical protein Q27BB25_04460 [Blastomonas sp. CACIA14H2]|uniref:hypothetical protein n=1 Tax=Blastomonas sp. CACIA14H2 TaxID=1419876 RepID=UPI0003CFF1BA|nr:MAG: hypothetical protein Q27BB25_04460 [Blastomonas sp. CACIA14H2]